MKRLFCLCAVLIVAVVPAFAVDSYSFYESDPVVSSDLSLLDYAVMPLDLSSSESGWLQGIFQTLVNSTYLNSPSILGNLRNIASDVDSVPSIVSDVDAIRVALTSNSQSSILGYLYDISYNTEGVRTYISNLSLLSDITSTAVSILSETRSIETVANSILSDTSVLETNSSTILSRLNSLLSNYTFQVNLPNKFGTSDYSSVVGPANLPYWINQIGVQLGYDVELSHTKERSLYSRIKQLQETLASDDDKALANSQKANREEIESSFLSGSSGDTSLGASDFGALSDVGGTIKDSISLNGQSSISGFTTGLSDADSSAQGWFSESTKNALDTVSSSASYDLRSDPYNMSGWQDRYAWLEGE